MLQRLTSGHIVWRTEDGACGSLSPEVIEKLSRWAQRRFYMKEAGGLILGFVDNDTNGLLAEEVTVPGGGDRRSRTSFFRSERHQREAEIWNSRTSGKGTQLGLWHTHPEADPTPSYVDIQDCENILRNGRFDCNGLLYLIIGTESTGFWHARSGRSLNLLGYMKT